ncbi:helix-turn-helix domain-containing protein [Sphaerisporangium sp. TRM90804]|uniref:PucR family transcriptional regulator n=1 Tax=Sphaerisporangium sp. TRM90804 TaxID=3031113 RepID=UPI00244CBD58|nr:helix-turn-helix domain-containing protein [Sphaerisporangium sp. TRM90804]MDH2425587.1 helix-turn-helix domain-containing protein [Sphaerisporangium sp. TRM90804]
MSQRPRASLGRVLDDLGSTLLELVAGDVGHPEGISALVIFDPLDEPVLAPRSLVLGVGVVPDAGALVPLLRSLGAHDTVGLVVRAPVALTPQVRAAVQESGVALIGLRRGATWAQLTALIRVLLAEDDIGVTGHESLGGLPSGDLFAVANAVSALLDAPITIEDRSSRVLAFSGRQDEADSSRVETVIGRQVPERYAARLTELGVFRDLYRHQAPVVVRPQDLGPDDAMTVQRVAIAVRAGDEVLGSIWAAMDGEVDAERTQALLDASKLVALHLLRLRASADVQRRLRTDLIATVLEGGTGARDALARLGLSARRLVIVGAGLLAGDDHTHTDLERLGDVLSVHLSATVPSSAVAAVSGTVYGLLPVVVTSGSPEQRAARLAADFVDRVDGNLHAIVAVAPAGSDISGIVHGKAQADRVLRVMREGHTSLRVAQLDDVQTLALLLELRDLAASRDERPGGAIARLMEYDERNNAGLIESLEAWLDALGDVGKAAGNLFIHPNTLRYRLKRVAEVGEIDLTDPEQRFAAMLQLRILAPR